MAQTQRATKFRSYFKLFVSVFSSFATISNLIKAIEFLISILKRCR